MPHTEELLGAILAVWGSRDLCGRGPVPWSALEERIESDLTGRTDRPSLTRAHRGHDVPPQPPAEWLEALREDGTTRLALLEPSGANVPRPPGWEAPPDARMLHAFAGTGGVLLVAGRPDGMTAWRTRIARTPPTLLTTADVLAFVARQASADALREALLWQDEHNLHVTDGSDWRRFVAALGTSHDEQLVRAMDMAVGNVRFMPREAEAWWALKRAHKNPREAWQYALVEEGPVEAAFDADVAGWAARLEAALVAVADYARTAPKDSCAGGWVETFEAARACLRTPDPTSRLRPLFEGSGMEERALRLIDAASAADVFGGMGSWNDLGLDDAVYARVSGNLYEALLPSLVAAVNASTAP